MKMKCVSQAIFAVVLTVLYSGSVVGSKEAIKHVNLPDITSYQEAKEVFNQTTTELRQKDKYDETELREIHLITYSLEKAIAYFLENMEHDQQASAKKLAELVELIHIGSENNRATETKVHLKAYFQIADTYSKSF